VTDTVVSPDRDGTDGRAPTELSPRVCTILDVTGEILCEHGEAGLQLRDVARRAKVSLSTIYAHFPSRDELLVAALVRWIDTHHYGDVPPPEPGEPLSAALTRLFRQQYVPWQRHPTMLGVVVRATLLPGGEQLWIRGPQRLVLDEYYEGYDPDVVRDVRTTLTYVALGLISAYAGGRVDAAEMFRVFERAADRLTADLGPPRPLDAAAS
jgi:AcrR family transcriptional regulator